MTTANRRRFVYDVKQKKVVPAEHELPERMAPGAAWHGYLSQSQSVHPKDVARYNEALKKSGVTGCQYRPDGRLEVGGRGAQHRRAKAFGQFVHDDVR